MTKPLDGERVKRLRRENQQLRQTVAVYETAGKGILGSVGLLLVGPSVVTSLRRFLLASSPRKPFPANETASLGAAIIRRLTRAGLLAILITSSILVWQNLLIRAQNRYFQEQNQVLVRSELRAQRDNYLGTIYDLQCGSLADELAGRCEPAHSKSNRERAVKGLLELLREPGADQIEIVLADADLRSLGLAGVDFRNADLTSARLDGANLKGARFDGALLDG